MARRGLTFVELLVAATIFAILAMGLSSHLRGGIDVWRRVTASTADAQRLRVIGDRLRSDLANSVVVSTQQMEPKVSLTPVFQKDQLAFVTALPASASNPAGPRRLRFVRYTWKDNTLERTECAFQEALAGVCGKPHSLGKAAEGSQGAFKVRYAFLPAPGAAGLEWHEVWPDPKKLPRVMEARVSLGKAAALSVSQQLPIPQGSLQTLADAQPSPAPSPGVPPAGPAVP